MGGYANRILRVDLTERKLSEESLSDGLKHDYIGGRGMAARMLYDDLSPGVDPLGPDNELILLTGPLAGTSAQSVSRWKVFFKSPLTGGYFKSSGGGRLGAELKAAGFDGVVVRGASDRPVYLWIRDGEYELRDATYLWGLDCDDTHTLIREELRDPNIRIACIGPAGENLVRYAGVFSDRRSAARGGGGTVMGAKRLKAIAVRGHGGIELSDPEGFKSLVREQIATYRAHPRFELFSSRGTQNPDFSSLLGMYPTRNFREGVLPDWQKIEAAEYTKLRIRHTACYNCMVHCGNITKVSEGKYRGAWSEGPEYESIWSFTGPIASSDIGLTVAGDKLCDELGLDCISTGVSIGFAYELYERGLVSTKDTGGLELTWGNDQPVLDLVRRIAYRQGIGDLLAEGVREMARRLGRGTEDYAMHVKGLEFPAYDPRGAKAHGLNLMTTAIGADHCSGYGIQEVFGQPYKGEKVDRFATQDKGEMTKFNQDLTAVQDSTILCVFPSLYYIRGTGLLGKLLAGATGIKDFTDGDYLMLVGERINNLERMFNVREGFGRKDDVMPRRITGETLPSGPSAGKVFEASTLLDDYYRARGWDLETGIPTSAKLNELGLSLDSR